MSSTHSGDWRLIPAGHLARALGVPSSVLSYYEARLPGVRAVADRGGRAYRRADAMVLAGIATEVADGATLSKVLERVGEGGRDSLTVRGRRIVDGAFPSERDPEEERPARPVPPDAIVVARDGRPAQAPQPSTARANREAILRALSDCVQILQRAR